MLPPQQLATVAAKQQHHKGRQESIRHGPPPAPTVLLVLAHALLEEVGLALQADDLHPVKGVGRVPLLLAAQGHQQPAGMARVGMGVRDRVSEEHGGRRKGIGPRALAQRSSAATLAPAWAAEAGTTAAAPSPPTHTNTREQPHLSATNSMYWTMSLQFMPIRSTGSASDTKSFSMVTASTTMSRTRSSDTLLFIMLHGRGWGVGRACDEGCPRGTLAVPEPRP